MLLKIKLQLVIACLVMLIVSVTTYANNQQLRSGVIPESLTDAEWLQIKQQIKQTQSSKRLNQVIEQQAYVKASNTDDGDSFGFSVAISVDTLVVGAYLEDSNATGINGDETDNTLSGGAGAVYVYVRTGETWSQEAYIKASNTGDNDWFGWSVAISGDTIVVGAKSEDSDATGVNGDEDNELRHNSGAAYVYTRDVNNDWSQQAYLKAFNTGSNDNFGQSVAISNDTIIIGAPNEDSSDTGINPDDGSGAINSGAIYVFTRSNGVWSHQAFIKASRTGAEDQFGYSVAISAETVVVGAFKEDSDSIGINSDELDDSALDSGAVYVFKRSANIWAQQAYIKASNTDAEDNFGHAVAVSLNTIVVGAYQEDSDATGANGDETNSNKMDSGAAYVFTRDINNEWSQQAYLKASNTDSIDYFGFAVAISDDTILVSAPLERSTATGINGNELYNSKQNAGAVYKFNRVFEIWQQQAYIKASNTGFNDQFGFSLAISGDILVAGAYLEDSDATGINGNEEDDSIDRAGAAYVFDFPTDLIFANGFESF